jgi:SAM-dependent methyltransferase
MYDQFSNDYDRFVNWPNRLVYEIPFLLEQLVALNPQNTPLHVLDAACGTGQHAIALAKAGVEVSGADLSGEMIRVAQENARKAGTPILFEAAGFGSLTTTFGVGKFDAVFCLGNSLPHVLTSKGLSETLDDFRGCLKPGGLLLIQNRNFDNVLLNHDRWMSPEAHVEGNREWLFQRFYDFETDGLIRFNIVTLTRETGKDWRSSVASTFLYPYTQMELEAVAAVSGFTGIQLYGSLANIPFDPRQSSNLVLTAIKP